MRLRLNKDDTVDEVFGNLHLEDLGGNGWYVGDLDDAEEQISLYADVCEDAPVWLRACVAVVDWMVDRGWMEPPWVIRGQLFYPRDYYRDAEGGEVTDDAA